MPVPWPFVILRLHCRGERQKINSGGKKWKRGGERARSWGAPFFCPLSLHLSSYLWYFFLLMHFPLSHPHYLKYYFRSIFFMFLLFYPHGCLGKALRCNIHYRIKLAKVGYHFDFSNPSHCIPQINILHLVTISNF